MQENHDQDQMNMQDLPNKSAESKPAKPEIRRVKIAAGDLSATGKISVEAITHQDISDRSGVRADDPTDTDRSAPADPFVQSHEREPIEQISETKLSVKRISLNESEPEPKQAAFIESLDSDELIDDFEILNNSVESAEDQTRIKLPAAPAGSNRAVAIDQTIVDDHSIRTDMSSLKQYLKKEPASTQNLKDLKPWEIDRQHGAKLYQLTGYTTVNKINRKFQAERQQRFLRQLLVTVLIIVFVILFVAILNPFKNINELKRILGISSMYGKSDPSGNLAPINTIQVTAPIPSESAAQE